MAELINENDVLTLEQRLKNAQDKWAYAEQELKTLYRTIEAEKYTLGELLKRKDELNGSLASLDEQKTKSESTLKSLRSEVQTAKNDLDTLQKDVGSLVEVKNDTQSQLKTAQSNLGSVTSEFKDISNKLETSKKELDNVNTEIFTKVEKFKKAVDGL